jgi:iron complex transport system substrate-binding protein
LRAVGDRRVTFADGSKYFNRSGITIVETVEILAEILHPDCVAPRWRGVVWREYWPTGIQNPAPTG